MMIMKRQVILIFLGIIISYSVQGCFLSFLPFVGGKNKKAVSLSVFDKRKFLEVREFDYPEYKWNKNGKFAEEMYAKIMADYFFAGQYKEAVEILESAKKVCPVDARLHVRIVECYARMGKYDEALKAMTEADESIKGFSRIEGITSYRNEINKVIESRQVALKKQKRPLWKKILFAPAKLWPF